MTKNENILYAYSEQDAWDPIGNMMATASIVNNDFTVTGSSTTQNFVVSNTMVVEGDTTLVSTTINGPVTTNGDTVNNGPVTHNSTTTLNGPLVDSSGNAGMPGQVLSTSGTSTTWVDAATNTDNQTLAVSALSANNTMTLASAMGTR